MGTSIPKRENELKGAPPSPVKEYKLSPEELAEIQGKPIPKSHSTPLGFRTKVKNTKPEEVRSDMAKIKKEDYLELRVKGSSRKDAAKKLGTSKQSLETYWFGKWGIKSDASEEVEIARYKEKQKKLVEPAASASDEEKTDQPPTQEPVVTEKITEHPPQHQTPESQPKHSTIPELPVRLTQEQANALALIIKHKPADEIVLRHSQTFIITRERWLGELDPLNDLTMDDMIRALYFDYEVVKTPEELLLQEFENAEVRFGAHSGVAFRTGLQIAAEIFGHKVEGVNA